MFALAPQVLFHVRFFVILCILFVVLNANKLIKIDKNELINCSAKKVGE